MEGPGRAELLGSWQGTEQRKSAREGQGETPGHTSMTHPDSPTSVLLHPWWIPKLVGLKLDSYLLLARAKRSVIPIWKYSALKDSALARYRKGYLRGVHASWFMSVALKPHAIMHL